MQPGKEFAHYYNLLGEIKVRLSKKEEALIYFEEALRINPYLFTALENALKISERNIITKTRFEEDILKLE